MAARAAAGHAVDCGGRWARLPRPHSTRDGRTDPGGGRRMRRRAHGSSGWSEERVMGGLPPWGLTMRRVVSRVVWPARYCSPARRTCSGRQWADNYCASRSRAKPSGPCDSLPLTHILSYLCAHQLVNNTMCKHSSVNPASMVREN